MNCQPPRPHRPTNKPPQPNQDLEASDVAEYERALDLWQISGMQKATARLIDGLEVVHTPGAKFSVS